ncbi:MAG: hypothetical protein LBC69_01910 [Eubacteriaceae bacterium]|jgi:YbbR domain-containing protein|nr:hypothetical protein [Eubacteriaceae bacterium]
MKQSFLSRYIKKEKIIRLFVSFGLAVMLWIVAMSDSNPVVRKKYNDIPLTVLGAEALNAGGLTFEPLPADVDVQLRGQNSAMGAISRDSITAFVDLGGIEQAGNYSLDVKLGNIPQNVTVSSMVPDKVSVAVSEIKAKSMNFTLLNDGALSTGYELLSRKYEARPVEVSGSETTLSSVVKVEGRLDLANRNDDFYAQVVLEALDASGKKVANATLAPSTISVSVGVGKSKTVSLSIKPKGACASGYFAKSVEALPKEVVIAAKEGLLEGITELLLEPVDLSGRFESFTSTGALVLPNGVSLLTKTPITVRVEIVHIDLREFSYESVQIRNTPPSLKVQPYEPGLINLTLITEPGGFDEFLQSDVTIFVDLAGLGIGEHNVKLEYELPKGISVKDTNRDEITVTLVEP